MSQWRNLIFEGGGVKGLAYAGALQILEQEGILENIVRVGGSSAGGITAMLLAIGAPPLEIKEILKETDFRKFMDDDWGVVRDIKRLFQEFGWHKGDAIKEWFKGKLKDRGLCEDITFMELHNKKNSLDLYMTGSNIEYMYTKVYSHEHTPDMPITDALRITMSFPFFFKAVNDKDDLGGELEVPKMFTFIDGGLLKNYPITLFDNKRYIKKEEAAAGKSDFDYITEDLKETGYVYNCQTLGLRIDSAKETKAYEQGLSFDQEVKGFLSYCFALINTLIEAANKAHLHKNDWHRTIFIENPEVMAMEFNLSNKQKDILVKKGQEGVIKYFKWFRDENHPEQPINKYQPENL